MTHWFPKALLFATSLTSIGCAAAPPPPPQYVYRSPDPSAEALAIEAARHHPNAQPRVRPEYPEQAPPPLPQGSSLPPPAYITRRADPPTLAPPDFATEPTWSSGYAGYSGYGPGYASYPYGYGYGYGYYPRAYPRWGFGVSLGYRSRYGWDRAYGYRDPWVGHLGRGYDRPSFRGQSAPHFHDGTAGGWRSGSVSSPSHGSFQAGGHSFRQPRANVRIGH